MEYDDKTLALAKFLEVDPALIENDYSEYFTVNSRTIKEGKTPEQFKKLAEDFRSLLNKELQELVTEAMLNPGKKIKVSDGKDEDDKPKTKEVEIQDHVYAVVEAFLEPMREKSKKRVEQLERLNVNTWKPPIKETTLDVYARLDKEHFHVVNILYHLVKAEADRYSNDDYMISLRRAWLGQPINDTRKDREVCDGEYLVLTDSEADTWERDGLESLFDDIVEIPPHLQDYIDKDKWIDDQSGDRGNNISSYDGEEKEVEFEGTTYYIYRNN